MFPQDGFHHYEATINGLRYHYVREGAGPPLLLVHGWPGFYYEWHLNIGPLSQHFDVVAPDMRGFGYTEKPALPPEEGYTPAAMAEDLRALLEALGWERAYVVAHDFGAIWVQQLALTYPQRIGKLVLFNPPYAGIGARWLEPSHLPEIWYILFHQLPLAEELVGSSRKAIEVYLRHFLSHWSHRKDLWTDEEIERYVDAFSQPGALRGGFNCYRAMLRGGGIPQGRIEVPTLVLWGESDPVLPVAWSDRLGDYFTHLTFKRVPQAGHFLMRERPELVNAEIIAFLGA
ncbi:MAG: alpha/beta hydrolase [Dehalococcoidia bacterium]|jgi:pimeloyl-ACP methyl ester carboxylesterase|nr:alpha/beta hydrolase [Dehalococcoidia bacterium]